MIISNTQSEQVTVATVPTYRKVHHAFFAACIVLGPLLAVVGFAINPTIGVTVGHDAIAASVAANDGANLFHVLVGVVGSMLMPFAFLGMALLAMRGAPWLATIGGAIGMVGWITMAVFVGQDSLTYEMGQLGGSAQFVALWDQFNNNAVMSAYLYIFIIGHLLGPIILGIALGRARIIPLWAVIALVLSSSLQVIAFPTHIHSLLIASYSLLLLGAIPAARAMMKLEYASTANR